MELVRRRAGSLLAVGLILALGWTAAVTLSMPNWYDPTEACVHKFPLAADSSDVDIRTRWFPPAASCVFDGDVRQFISPARSAVLSVLGVLILVVLLTGLVLTVRRLSGDPGPIQTADDVNLGRRKFNQLTFGALDMGVAVAVLLFFNAVAIVFGGIPGGLLLIVAAIVGLSALGVVLDRRMGPLPSTALDSRRRGTVAGVTVFGVIFAATALSGQLPFFRLWSIPVGAIAYAAISAVQWSRRSRTSSPAQYSG
ncbi:MAG TPA: hypothetical protein VFI00_20550 [Kribbella sp.]|nr:hypothetical protein [Kribbella sp.]